MKWQRPDYNSYTEEQKREIIKTNPFAIENFKEVSEELKLFAVKTNPAAIDKIKNPSDELAKVALIELKRIIKERN